MKESVAKTKVCPVMTGPGGIVVCKGSECAAWEPDYVMEDSDNDGLYNISVNTPSKGRTALIELAKQQCDKTPSGDGWEIIDVQPQKKSGETGIWRCRVVWRRYVALDTGDCGMKPKHLECTGGL